MTESEWNSGMHFQKMVVMVDFMRGKGKVSARKVRLIMCALWHWLARWPPGPRGRYNKPDTS